MSRCTVQQLVTDVAKQFEGTPASPEVLEVMSVTVNNELVAQGVRGLRARVLPDLSVELHIVDRNDRVTDNWYKEA